MVGSIIDKSITNIYNSRATKIGDSVFQSCYNLTTADFPNAIIIGSYAFYSCSKLTTVSFPNCTRVGDNAFYNCRSLTTVNFPNCTSIGTTAFYYCYNLTEIDFPICSKINQSAFQYCTSLTTISFPVCIDIGAYAFYHCESLTTANFPNCNVIRPSAFANCESLTTASFPACISIYTSVFDKCWNLKSLYLTGSSICKLLYSSAFTSTPIGGYSASAGTYGSIYVPASLYSQYISSTNWVYFSSRFVSIGGDTSGSGGETGGDTSGSGEEIEFIINYYRERIDCYAKSGMTWEQWVNDSNYYTEELDMYYGFSYMILSSSSSEKIYDSYDTPIAKEDVIVPNEEYMVEEIPDT